VLTFKFLSDNPVWNSDFIHESLLPYFPLINLTTMATLERSVLFVLNYRLVLTPTTYFFYVMVLLTLEESEEEEQFDEFDEMEQDECFVQSDDEIFYQHALNVVPWGLNGACVWS